MHRKPKTINLYKNSAAKNAYLLLDVGNYVSSDPNQIPENYMYNEAEDYELDSKQKKFTVSD